MVNPRKTKRVTIMLDMDTDKTLHYIQAAEIKRTGRSHSFSKVINQVLVKGIKVTK